MPARRASFEVALFQPRQWRQHKAWGASPRDSGRFVYLAPEGNAVKHFASHEISRHALASGSPRNRGLARIIQARRASEENSLIPSLARQASIHGVLGKIAASSDAG